MGRFRLETIAAAGVIYKTCEEVNIGTQELYARNDESLCTGSVLKCGV